MNSYFLACTLYPEKLKSAQEEVDRVVGTGRLPTFADRESLPYIGALVKELLRWNPAAPLGKEAIHIPVHRVWRLKFFKNSTFPSNSGG